MDRNTKDILDTVNFIKDHMLTKEEGATKDDVRDIIRKEVPQIVRNETKDIRAELASIRRDLEALTGKVDNIVDLPKEIDHALERIAAIEKHLGLSKKIAA
jgi:hypothetical protein